MKMKKREMVINKLDKVRLGDKIGVPMTPGYWISKQVTYISVTELTMTTNGVVSNVWKTYIKRISLEDLANKDKVVAETYDGNKILINMNYVVSAKYYTIASAEYYSENPYSEKGNYTCYYLMKDGNKAKLVDEYDGRVD